ncbi:hypothetical protein SAMN00017405_0433 [Desulfonispora thiosulfatigenes DSM 11270]|uniref:Uncharacterized protein n=1 Tax=Desulfonispora thiosulfatigenes DSM 11270 TaxID=656914 RepID=A0A1W1VQS3_DESTI|nr:hypothetical protein [Desulfonispora thiosulfatigenes]SMB95570.1 hypothetical protein SAMN00017405_0433 [Desulfonispora thiosulfatigenes DSM 11270]
MTNEDFQRLVLEKLNELTTDVSEIKSNISGLKSDVNDLKLAQKELKSDTSDLKLGQNEINRKMDAVYEQTAMLSEFKTEVNEKLEDIQVDINFLTRKVAQSDAQIIKLKRDLRKVE